MKHTVVIEFNMQRKTTMGFTLVEMLVVIAIVGILSTLLLPVFSKAKEKGSSTQCKNNLHELGLAVRMYLDETGRWPVQPVGLERLSQDRTSAYYRHPPTNKSIWYCPSWRDGNPIDSFGTYQINGNGSGNVNFYKASSADNPLGIASGPGGFDGRRESEIINPADMIIFGEMYYGEALPGARWEAPSYPFNHSTGYFFMFRHNKRANSLFADGHVGSADRDGLIGKADAVRLHWNYDDQPHDENWR